MPEAGHPGAFRGGADRYRVRSAAVVRAERVEFDAALRFADGARRRDRTGNRSVSRSVVDIADGHLRLVLPAALRWLRRVWLSLRTVSASRRDSPDFLLRRRLFVVTRSA